MLLASVIFHFETPALEIEFNLNYLLSSPLRQPITLILYRKMSFLRESYATLTERTCLCPLNLMVHIVTIGNFVSPFSASLPIEINASTPAIWWRILGLLLKAIVEIRKVLRTYLMGP
jgi:hypothetical protein